MEIYTSINIEEAFRTIPEIEFIRFFDSLRQNKLAQIEFTPPEDLTAIQAQVKMITEMQGIFQRLREQALNQT